MRQGQVYRVRAKNGAIVRKGVELDSDVVGEPLAVGTEISVEDASTNSRGVERLRIKQPSGWVSRKVVEAMAAPAAPPREPDPRTEPGLGPMPPGHPCPPQPIGALSDRRNVATLAMG